MRLVTTLISFILIFNSFAQQSIQVKIEGNLFNAKEDSVILSQYFGTHYVDYAVVPLSKNGDFNIETSVPNPDYYVLRLDKQHVNLILRDQAHIKVYGDGQRLDKFCNVLGSDESSQMNSFAQNLEAWNKVKDSAITMVKNDPSKKEEVNAFYSREYYSFQGTVQSYIKENQGSPALLPVLGAVDPQNDWKTYEMIVTQLASSFGESPTIKSVYQSYLQNKKAKEASDVFAPGKPAPDFEELLLDRKTTMKLSDLKGKVVLLDFWASWCGPCRKENPNVVRLYEKYKDQGFTVMSVSLDSDLGRWKAAIEQDNLSWPNHVSDLNKWASAAAKIYGVNSIPFTVLIDQEGNIIQTNLRGGVLEAKLAEIFGE